MTMYGHEHYSPDQLAFHQKPTLGEFPVVTPPRPTTEPLAHSGYVKPPIDQLASHAQRVIEEYAEEILKGITHCHCDSCKTFVKTLLSDAIGEVLTDVHIITLALGKQQREFGRLNDNIERLLRREVKR